MKKILKWAGFGFLGISFLILFFSASSNWTRLLFVAETACVIFVYRKLVQHWVTKGWSALVSQASSVTVCYVAWCIVASFSIGSSLKSDKPTEQVASASEPAAIAPANSQAKKADDHYLVGVAKPYTVAKDDDGQDNRKAKFHIVAPDAISKADRAATVKKAAMELAPGKLVKVVFLAFDQSVVGSGNNLASANYFADGCGFSGRECDGKEWEIQATDAQVSAEQLTISREWENNKKRFTDKTGNIDEQKLTRFLAKKLGTTAEKISLPFISDLKPVNAYSSADDEAAAKTRMAEKATALEARKKSIEAQFSPWDGAHRSLERVIKEKMNDPSSYEHSATQYFDMGDHLIVNTEYRGKNSYGGVVKGFTKAKVGLDGEVIEILESR